MKKIRYNIVQLFMIIYILFLIIVSPKITGPTFYLYINPICLIIIMIASYIYTENSHGRFENLKENMKSVLIATLFYIIIYFLGGLIFGFSYSIYSHKLLDIIKNIWQIIIPIIAIEYTRSAIINENRKNYLFVFLFTIIFILVEINYYRLFNTINNKESLFKYFSSSILPLIFGNILYTYLTIKGSYKLVYIYRITFESLLLIVPVFPSYDWFLTGTIGVLTPGIIYLFLRVEKGRRIRREGRKRKKESAIGYIPPIFILIVFICFMAGIFKYEPIAILSNSMNPLFYKGDVVVYSKNTENELKKLKKDTIIVYNKENQMIVHRIIRRYKKNGIVYYITKGDANMTQDKDPVESKDIIGVYQCHIKYIGYPSVLLNRYFKHEDAKVEIK